MAAARSTCAINSSPISNTRRPAVASPSLRLARSSACCKASPRIPLFSTQRSPDPASPTTPLQQRAEIAWPIKPRRSSMRTHRRMRPPPRRPRRLKTSRSSFKIWKPGGNPLPRRCASATPWTRSIRSPATSPVCPAARISSGSPARFRSSSRETSPRRAIPSPAPPI